MSSSNNEEVVKAFNQELLTLKNGKSALSKQKIVDITKAAMSALKYYKHVVYSVENFISRCSSKLKIPGLYVIDSIVRQGQKQFREKDVFGPRFAVNIQTTIGNILKSCPADDRLKVVRVINLWKTNDVFGTEVWSALLQQCDKMGLEIDVAKVEMKVKGTKANLSIYNMNPSRKTPRTPPPQNGSESKFNGDVDPVSTVTESQFHDFITCTNAALADGLRRDPDALKKAFRSFQNRLKDAVEKEKAAAGQNISSLLTKTFDYSDDEDEDDRKKPTEHLPKERVDASPSRSDPRKKKHRDRSSERKDKRRDRSRSPESAADKDREKERKKNGLPTHPKSGVLVLATRTLWFGRLPPNCVEEQVKEALRVTGYEPERVNIINSRACAYVTMPSRRAAFKTLDKYKRDIKVGDKSVKMDWATGQGLQKNEKMMDFWDPDKGYAQIPHNKLPKELSSLLQGNYVDVDTLPREMRGKYNSTGVLPETAGLAAQPPADPDPALLSIPTPAAAAQPPPFAGVPPPPGLPFPPLNLPPNFIQPNLLAAVLAQQQNFDQLMSSFQQGNPGLLPPPGLGGPLPQTPDGADRGLHMSLGGGRGALRPAFSTPRMEGPPPAFFRGNSDFRPRGRGAFRGRGMPMLARGGLAFPPRPDAGTSANSVPLGLAQSLLGAPPAHLPKPLGFEPMDIAEAEIRTPGAATPPLPAPEEQPRPALLPLFSMPHHDLEPHFSGDQDDGNDNQPLSPMNTAQTPPHEEED